MIKVDVTVSNLSFRAAKPDNQKLPIPNDDIGKTIFFNTVDSDRLNKRVFGSLKGKALSEASKIVHKYGGINISGIYGSISVSEKDFIPSTEGK